MVLWLYLVSKVPDYFHTWRASGAGNLVHLPEAESGNVGLEFTWFSPTKFPPSPGHWKSIETYNEMKRELATHDLHDVCRSLTHPTRRS